LRYLDAPFWSGSNLRYADGAVHREGDRRDRRVQAGLGGLQAAGARARAGHGDGQVAHRSLQRVRRALSGEAPSWTVAVVPTGPVSLKWNTGWPENAAEPVSFPEIVSVPDIGAALAVAVLLPDQGHAASPAASASIAVRAARFSYLARVSPCC
jgi:hypothetical protein